MGYVVLASLLLLLINMCSCGTVLMGWGYNSYYTLGLGHASQVATPTVIPLMELAGYNLTDVRLCQSSQLALRSDGMMYGAGRNGYGELNMVGQEKRYYEKTLMSACLASKTIKTIFMSALSGYAFTEEGDICSWGSNAFQQLGRTASLSGNPPGAVSQATVLAGKSILKWSAGYRHVLLIMSDNNLYGWGANDVGNLGLGTTNPGFAYPISIPMTAFGNSTLVDVTCGQFFSMAMTLEGEVFIWGSSPGLSGSTPQKMVIPGEREAIQMAAGDEHCLVLCSDGTLWSWGPNGYGQLGDGTYTARSTPVQMNLSGLGGRIIIKITAAYRSSFVVAEFADGSSRRFFSCGGGYGQLGAGVSQRNTLQPVLHQNNWATPVTIETHPTTLSIVGVYYCPDDNYVGQTCSTPICYGRASPDPTVCSGHGTCSNPNNCTCSSGWHSQNCSQFNCNAVNDCSMNGVCVGANTCQCSSEWTGPSCQIPICFFKNSSDPLVCSGHGTCQAPDNCTCGEGYFGNSCELFTCNGVLNTNETACSSAGNCTSLDVCTCLPDYFGTYCEAFANMCFGFNESDVLVCSGNGLCIGPNNCSCTSGYVGAECSIPVCYGTAATDNPCSGHGICSFADQCDCEPGYLGDNCELFQCYGINSTDPIVCNYMNGSCVAPDTCNCSQGYDGLDCSDPICFGSSATDACGLYGYCEAPDTCSCSTGYTGDDCSAPVCFGKFGTIACGQFGECTQPDVCSCDPNYYGDECEQFQCYGVDSTDQTVCNYMNGTCVAPDTCNCSQGYDGLDCSDPICFGSSATDACGLYGYCEAPDICVCNPDYFGDTCEEYLCYGINGQNDSVCSSRGSCVAPDNCSCSDPNYFGNQCEKYRCHGVESTDTSVCSNMNGTCIQPDVCSCNAGWSGTNCEVAECYGRVIPCSGNGNCILPDTCVCNNGFSGQECEVFTCSGTNASNETVCSRRGSCDGLDQCTCQLDYSGDNCQFSVCFGFNSSSPSVCSSQGSCIDTNLCSCNNAYVGAECEIVACFGKNNSDPAVCSGHGFCSGPDYCECIGSYGGLQCDTQLVSYINVTYSNAYEVCSNVTISGVQAIISSVPVAATITYSAIDSAESAIQTYLSTRTNMTNLEIPSSYFMPGRQYQISIASVYLGGHSMNRTLTFTIQDYTPVVTLSGPSGSVARKSEIQITSQVTMPVCINPVVSYSWSVSSVAVQSNTSTLTILPYTFPVQGQYNVTLVVKERTNTIVRDTVLNVISDPVFANIKGGNVALGFNKEYMLDASMSMDPEYPATSLNYTWGCLTQAQTPCSNFTNSAEVLQRFTGVQAGFFTLVLLVQSAYGRYGRTNITIEVKSPQGLLPAVEIVTSLGSYTSTNKKISLLANVTPISALGEIALKWYVTAQGNSTNLLDHFISSNILTQPGSRNLVLKENILTKGVTYTFTISARYKNQTESVYSSISTIMSNGPSIGTFVITPDRGSILGTKFKLKASNWTDDTGSLEYAFDYWDAQSKSFKLLRAYSTLSEVNTPLFNEIVGESVIRCRSRNSYGDEASMTATVQLETAEIDLSTYLEQKRNESSQQLSADIGFTLVAVATLSSNANYSSDLIDSMLNLVNTTNGLSGDATLKNQIQAQSTVALQIISKQSEKLSTTQKANVIGSLKQILKTLSEYNEDVAKNTISVVVNLNYDKSSTSTVLDDLSRYTLQSLVPGQSPVTINTTGLSLTVQKNYASSLENTVLSSDASSSSVQVPYISMLLENGEDTVYSLEYISYPDPEELSLWTTDSTNISTSVVTFKILDANGEKIAISTDENNPLVIAISRSGLFDDQSVQVCKYIESPDDLKWETDGCKVYSVSDEQVICHCNHTTSFAAFIEYTQEDVQSISPISQAVFIVEVVFSGFYIVIIVALLIFLVVNRKVQPIRSRLLAPYVCLVALLIELSLSGVVRNSLLLAKSSYIAIDSVGKGILIVCNPLAIVSLFILMYQHLRYLVLRRVYELMGPSPKLLFRIGKLLTSRLLFALLSFVVYGLSLAYYVAFSAVAISQYRKLNETKSTYLTLVSAVSYSATMIALSLVIIAIFLWDSIIIPIQTSRRDKVRRKQSTELSGQPDKGATSTTPILSMLKSHFYSEDPLFFRIDGLFLLASVLVGLVSFGIGIANRYLLKRDDSPVMIVWLVFDLLYTLLRIIAFGGSVALIRIVSLVRTKGEYSRLENIETIEDASDAINIVLAVLRNKSGFYLLKEYSIKEMSTENLLLWIEMERLLLDWLTMSDGQRQETLDSMYTRYIQSGSPNEINIPAGLKKRLLALQKNLLEQSPNDQLLVLQGLYNQLLVNIADTFSRFSETQFYEQYIHATLLQKALQDLDMREDKDNVVKFFQYELHAINSGDDTK